VSDSIDVRSASEHRVAKMKGERLVGSPSVVSQFKPPMNILLWDWEIAKTEIDEDRNRI
jgi:hypothetical protein